MKPQLSHALFSAALCCGAAISASASAATTAVVNLTLDTAAIVVGTDPGQFTGNAVGGFSPAFSVDLSAGDSLDLTIDFKDNQTLTINKLLTIWAFSFADIGSDVKGTGRFQFLDGSGGVLLESLEKTDVEGTVHFGQFFDDVDFANLPSTITFSGVRYFGTVVEYLEPSVTTRTYNSPGFAFNAESFTAQVPEPGTWALMLAGVGVLGAAVRRRKAV